MPVTDRKQQIIAILEKQDFSDVYIIAEMVNRFEGEVMLKMDGDPSLSLERALEYAMKEAHKNFVLPGHYPIVQYYKVLVRKKYRAIYRSSLKKVVTGPVSLIGALLFAFLGYEGYVWAGTHFRVWGINGVAVTMYALWLLLTVMLMIKFSVKKKNTEILDAIVSRDIWAGMFLFVIMPSGSNSGKALIFTGGICAIGCFYLMISSLAKYATLKKASADLLSSGFQSGVTVPT